MDEQMKDSRGLGFQGSSEMVKTRLQSLEPSTPWILEPFLTQNGKDKQNLNLFLGG